MTSAHARRTTPTPQQRRIIALVAQGHSNRQAARLMGLAEKTVKNHLYDIFEVMHVASRNAMVFQAVRLGYVPCPYAHPSRPPKRRPRPRPRPSRRMSQHPEAFKDKEEGTP